MVLYKCNEYNVSVLKIMNVSSLLVTIRYSLLVRPQS